MFTKEPYVITSLTEYLEIIELIHKENNGKTLYRGQASHVKFKLLPSLYRKYDDGLTDVYSYECEEIFLSKFKSKSIPYLKTLPQNDWEWMFLMQHYNTPTRLLDWSESPLVALFFALDDSFNHKEEDSAVVWCLNPIALNKKFRPIESLSEIPNINGSEVLNNSINRYYAYGEAYPADYPIAVTGPLNNSRISAQKGMFTLFPALSKTPLEETKECNDFLEKIIIKKENISIIKRQLFTMGITNTSIYPDLDSISKDIKLEYSVIRSCN
ncbi:FRG domain-containing protein [Clostridium sp. D53t1_180928_C8]|uniref:FRG domain-containing protein n=1 Tax=Clostridium sp. D53t1_180928_C8 TaxID=2787101 RepID=UPI0018AA8874|nr:FRG domain-containing protein [Clostridium sp. D53t1_180928_C8]